jgi:TRAP-type C4-dicarboxylate transport system permease small subunit
MKKEKKEIKKPKEKNKETGSSSAILQEETIRGIVAVLFFVLSIFFILASFHKAGMVGEKSYELLSYLFGVGFYVLPILFLILCISFFRTLHKKLALTHSVGGLLFFFLVLEL